MASGDEQIAVSERVKRHLDRRRCGDESYNDVLERLLSTGNDGEFNEGFGSLSDSEADRIQEEQKRSKSKRKERARRLDESS